MSRHDPTTGLTALLCWLIHPHAKPIPGGAKGIAEHFGIENVEYVRGYLRLHGRDA